MDRLISFTLGINSLAIIEHDGKWYCPSKFIRLEPEMFSLSFEIFESNNMNINDLIDTTVLPKIKRIDIPIQQHESGIIYAYCKEADTLGIK